MIKEIEKIPLVASKKYLYFSLCLIGGIFIASLINLNFVAIWPYLPLLFSIFVLVIFLNFLLKNHLFVLVGFCLLFLFTGFFYFSYFQFKTFIAWPKDEAATISAYIVSQPQREINRQKLLVKVIKKNIRGAESTVNDGLIIANVSLLPHLQYGDLVEIKGKISQPIVNEDFDYQRYLKKYPVYGVINQAEGINLVSRSKKPGVVILRSLYSFSAKLEDSLNLTLPEPHASLAAGIILGQKRSLPQGFTDDLNKVGLSHIVAISGFNVTIIFVVLGGILSTYLKPKSVFYLGVILALILVLMTGMSPSIIRAAIFSLLILFGRTIGRMASQVNLILLAATVMLLVNPFYLRYDLGFQLSFLAFLGLVYISPIFKHYLYQSKNELLQTWVLTPLAETLGAQLAITPLIMMMFGRLSLISPLSNLLSLWAVELVMAFAFSTAFLGLISIWLAQFSAHLLWPLLEYIVRVVEMLARLPFASLEIGKNSWSIEVVFYLIIGGVLKFFYSKKHLREKII